MSSRYVYNTVLAYLKQNWVETRLLETLNYFDSPSGDPLVEWALMMPQEAIETQMSVGSPGFQRWREEGNIAFIAFVPSGTGPDRALELAEMFRDLFREKQIDDGAGGPTIVVQQVDPPDTALPSAVDASSGAWFGYSVSAAYYCDFCRQT